MTLREKAKEKFGQEYISQCPSLVFEIPCLAISDFPICHDESCWKYHQTDKIEYKENPKDIFKQQL
jgi:hypothetical protein